MYYTMGGEINDFDRSDLHHVGTQSDLVNPTSLVEEDMWITSLWSRKRDGLIEFDELVNFPCRYSVRFGERRDTRRGENFFPGVN